MDSPGKVIGVPLPQGKTTTLLSEADGVAGIRSVTFPIDSDNILVSLWVDSITTGTLDVSVYTQTEEGKQQLLFSFPTISSPTPSLVLKESLRCMSIVRVVATVTGDAVFEVRARGVLGVAEAASNVTIVAPLPLPVTDTGVTSPTVSQVSMTLADTEYSYSIPVGTRQFMIKTSSGASLKLAYSAGQSGTTFITVPEGCFYGESAMLTTGPLTLYFQSPSASEIAEIISWI